MNDVFKKGYKHPLENSDIYEILPEDESQELTDRLERLVNKKLFPAYTGAIFDCVVRKAYNLLTVITSSIANSPK